MGSLVKCDEGAHTQVTCYTHTFQARGDAVNPKSRSLVAWMEIGGRRGQDLWTLGPHGLLWPRQGYPMHDPPGLRRDLQP